MPATKIGRACRHLWWRLSLFPALQKRYQMRDEKSWNMEYIQRNQRQPGIPSKNIRTHLQLFPQLICYDNFINLSPSIEPKPNSSRNSNLHSRHRTWKRKLKIAVNQQILEKIKLTLPAREELRNDFYAPRCQWYKTSRSRAGFWTVPNTQSEPEA